LFSYKKSLHLKAFFISGVISWFIIVTSYVDAIHPDANYVNVGLCK
jgi:hypothetical protein